MQEPSPYQPPAETGGADEPRDVRLKRTVTRLATILLVLPVLLTGFMLYCTPRWEAVLKDLLGDGEALPFLSRITVGYYPCVVVLPLVSALMVFLFGRASYRSSRAFWLLSGIVLAPALVGLLWFIGVIMPFIGAITP